MGIRFPSASTIFDAPYDTPKSWRRRQNSAHVEVGRNARKPRTIPMSCSRFASGSASQATTSSRCSTPTYADSGRIKAFDWVCSMMWAVQPVMRLMTKMGVNISMSKPIR